MCMMLAISHLFYSTYILWSKLEINFKLSITMEKLIITRETSSEANDISVPAVKWCGQLLHTCVCIFVCMYCLYVHLLSFILLFNVIFKIIFYSYLISWMRDHCFSNSFIPTLFKNFVPIVTWRNWQVFLLNYKCLCCDKGYTWLQFSF